MRRYSDGAILRLGAMTMVLLVLIVAAAFNLSKFPGFGGDMYRGEFSDASGMRRGDMVQVAGTRVGRVDSIELAGDRVIVNFEVDHGVEFGEESEASIEVLNLLGQKFLQLKPVGSGQLSTDETIPLERTDSAYDIVGVLGDLATTTEGIDTERLGTALDTVSETLDGSSEEIKGTFSGLARLSRTISSRDAELQTLLQRSNSVSTLLAERRGDLTTLIKEGDLLLQELQRRREAIHTLLVNTSRLSQQLTGLVQDNQAQMAPALRQLREVLGVLQDKEKQLSATIHSLAPYSSILGNIIGTGPWFDAYVVNLFGLAGEFTPGTRDGG